MSPSENPLSLLIDGLLRHSDLSDDDQQRILALPYRMRTYESSSYLVSEGERPEHCSIMVSGFSYRQKQTSGGQRQIVSLHIPGEALDFQHLFLEIADHSVQMLTRGEVALVAMQDLRALVDENPALNQAITRRILVEASIFREWILNVGRRDARSRMAHLLCEFAIRMRASGLSGDHSYELPITQEQFADAVGLTTVHVNRTLRALEGEGFVLRNKRTLFIPSWKRLAAIADFNERYLHLNTDPIDRSETSPWSARAG